MKYKLPTIKITLDTVKAILAGEQCFNTSCSEQSQDVCAACVLTGTTANEFSNALDHLVKDIFLTRLVEYKVINKAEALQLTLDGDEHNE